MTNFERTQRSVHREWFCLRSMHCNGWATSIQNNNNNNKHMQSDTGRKRYIVTQYSCRRVPWIAVLFNWSY